MPSEADARLKVSGTEELDDESNKKACALNHLENSHESPSN